MKRILVIEDEVQALDMIVLGLEASQYEVITAHDGQEGLEKAKSENPDLVLCDVMMPKMDGYKVCGLLKNDARYKKIPVILITARAQNEDLKLGKEVQADAYIIKPFKSSDLLAKIDELL